MNRIQVVFSQKKLFYEPITESNGTVELGGRLETCGNSGKF